MILSNMGRYIKDLRKRWPSLRNPFFYYLYSSVNKNWPFFCNLRLYESWWACWIETTLIPQWSISENLIRKIAKFRHPEWNFFFKSHSNKKLLMVLCFQDFFEHFSTTKDVATFSNFGRFFYWFAPAISELNSQYYITVVLRTWFEAINVTFHFELVALSLPWLVNCRNKIFAHSQTSWYFWFVYFWIGDWQFSFR